jgi:NAD(P)-dependent dehydrogenase (short-subunit alcohol dehydrogenase family)
MGDLEGRVALVTGGGRGIGAAIARDLAGRGAEVVVSSRTQADLDAVVESIGSEGGRATSRTTDAMDREQVRALGKFTLDQFGRIDILVNNVGGSASAAPGLKHDLDDAFLAGLTLNLVSAVWLSHSLLPSMREAQYGRIVNIGSGVSKRTGGPLSYVTAKHGLVGFSRQLAADEAASGITVNCVCPGWTNTTLFDWEEIASAMGGSVADARAYAESESMQKRVLEPEELCGMIGLLASSSGAGITGQVISVDGGYKV